MTLVSLLEISCLWAPVDDDFLQRVLSLSLTMRNTVPMLTTMKETTEGPTLYANMAIEVMSWKCSVKTNKKPVLLVAGSTRHCRFITAYVCMRLADARAMKKILSIKTRFLVNMLFTWNWYHLCKKKYNFNISSDAILMMTLSLVVWTL